MHITNCIILWQNFKLSLFFLLLLFCILKIYFKRLVFVFVFIYFVAFFESSKKKLQKFLGTFLFVFFFLFEHRKKEGRFVCCSFKLSCTNSTLCFFFNKWFLFSITEHKRLARVNFSYSYSIYVKMIGLNWIFLLRLFKTKANIKYLHFKYSKTIKQKEVSKKKNLKTTLVVCHHLSKLHNRNIELNSAQNI